MEMKSHNKISQQAINISNAQKKAYLSPTLSVMQLADETAGGNSDGAESNGAGNLLGS